MFSTVIFDLDGTLLDTLQDLAAAGNAALSRMGLPLHPVEDYKQMVGNGIAKLVERMLPENIREKNTLALAEHLFMKHYTQHSIDLTEPYEGITTLLDELKHMGTRMCVVTNKADPVAKEVVEHFFPSIFDNVYGFSESILPKPNPESTLQAIRFMGSTPQQALFCGDSDVDMLTANNAGLKACAVLWGFRTKEELAAAGANYFATDTNELKNIILELN